jgi:hypothetical protein
MRQLVPLERIEKRIFLMRGEKVLLDADLADLYGVETKQLVRAVKRNVSRFPPDFMFRLTRAEAASLRCQFGTSNAGRGGRRYLPLVFTEHGVAMLSSVLNSERAIAVNIAIVRTFVRLRGLAAESADFARKLEALEGNFDLKFRIVFAAIRQLMEEPKKKSKPIGFRAP